MKVTGYKLREALRRWQLRRDTAGAQFIDTLKVFPDEQKQTPQSVADYVNNAEQVIARLQTEQTIYNTRVTVSVGGAAPIPLLLAIKLVGGLGRVEKLWRTAAVGKKDKYQFYRSDDPSRRKADEVVAKAVVTPDEAAKLAADIGGTLGGLREAIAVGNATEIELDLDASLLD